MFKTTWNFVTSHSPSRCNAAGAVIPRQSSVLYDSDESSTHHSLKFLPMANHNPEDSAGAQLAMMVALKLLLSPYRCNEAAIAALESELERMRAMLLASPAEERKVAAFDESAESLIEVVRPKP